ncbi:MAG: CoA transferase, partial [Rhodospirillales bacterium]|nr:CoA transferase [Rhodospirillales bacterium]
IGPAPFCGMLLADLGAEVLRIDRREPADLGVDLGKDPRFAVLGRGKRSVAVDLKDARGRDLVLDLVRGADALIEGFRPGAMERLGLGPDACLAANPRLVFGRMTGWGQEGSLAKTAGHDINYIALAGVLHGIGRPDAPPSPPLNLIGDFGGGAMFLAVGVLSALLEAARSGKGQVVDAAMVDGAAYLMTAIYGMLAHGTWRDARGENILDGGAPWYGVYETKDGKYVAIGSIERRFYDELLRRLGLEGEKLPAQHDRSGWPLLKERFAAVFRTRTRDEWCAVFEGSDACLAPVLSMTEAPSHPHLAARRTFVEREGVVQPAPAPRFSRSRPEIASAPPRPGEHSETALLDWGVSKERVAELRKSGVIGAAG